MSFVQPRHSEKGYKIYVRKFIGDQLSSLYHIGVTLKEGSMPRTAPTQCRTTTQSYFDFTRGHDHTLAMI